MGRTITYLMRTHKNIHKNIKSSRVTSLYYSHNQYKCWMYMCIICMSLVISIMSSSLILTFDLGCGTGWGWGWLLVLDLFGGRGGVLRHFVTILCYIWIKTQRNSSTWSILRSDVLRPGHIKRYEEREFEAGSGIASQVNQGFIEGMNIRVKADCCGQRFSVKCT